jgi:hypothetical protein
MLRSPADLQPPSNRVVMGSFRPTLRSDQTTFQIVMIITMPRPALRLFPRDS